MSQIEVRDVQVEISADTESDEPVETCAVARDLGDLLAVHQERDDRGLASTRSRFLTSPASPPPITADDFVQG